jgi:hypothetical protein
MHYGVLVLQVLYSYPLIEHSAALLKEPMLDMQQLLKNPEKLPEISRATKP